MDGVLNIRKHEGPTSHDLVYRARQIFSQKRVGHAGTLDPMATGVLVVCLGKATRIVEYLMGTPKEYRARMALGQVTDSQDSTGIVLAEKDASGINREQLERAIEEFVGEIEQIPPMVSAIKHQGKPLYKLAREGKTIERTPRKLNVYSIQLLNFVPGKLAEAEILVGCSSGTYIRTLCHDIGEKLGCGGHMSMLERTKVGVFSIENAVTIEELENAKAEDRLEEYVLSINNALGAMPAVVLRSGDVDSVLHGNTVGIDGLPENGDIVRILAPDGDLIGLGMTDMVGTSAVLRPKKVLVDICVEVS